jgi:regulator of cell morphogenesis and NO signaling
MSTNIFIDVTELQPSLKHPTIFDAFDNVSHGGTVIIHNDHDPKPVYYQLLGLRGNCFSWTYLKNGPEVWEIEIKKNELSRGGETLGQIVSKDIRKAEVFKKLGLDFCCGGKKTLEAACIEKGLDENAVREELIKTEQQAAHMPDFNKWSLGFLADYIVNEHHNYVRENTPLLKELSAKVAEKHGDKYPWLLEIHNKLTVLLCELSTHMKKEESILFPYIKTLEQSGGAIQIGFETVQDPIWVMESDHDAAGELIHDISKLSNGYTAPEGACNSHKLFMYKLQEFENDLLQHVHLENNILFPKAVQLEKK